MVTFAMLRESENVSLYNIIFFLHMYIATHFNLNLYAPISTYKFSKLVSIHFLLELIKVQAATGNTLLYSHITANHDQFFKG